MPLITEKEKLPTRDPHTRPDVIYTAILSKTRRKADGWVMRVTITIAINGLEYTYPPEIMEPNATPTQVENFVSRWVHETKVLKSPYRILKQIRIVV